MYAASLDVHSLGRQRPEAPPAVLARKAVIFVAVSGVILLGLAKTVHGGGAQGLETIRVQPGDTLWSIAAARYPDSDPRLMVDQIAAENHLGSPVIVPGESLQVPPAHSSG